MNPENHGYTDSKGTMAARKGVLKLMKSKIPISEADIIIKVDPPTLEEIDLMKPKQCLMYEIECFIFRIKKEVINLNTWYSYHEYDFIFNNN